MDPSEGGPAVAVHHCVRASFSLSAFGVIKKMAFLGALRLRLPVHTTACTGSFDMSIVPSSLYFMDILAAPEHGLSEEGVGLRGWSTVERLGEVDFGCPGSYAFIVAW